MKLRLLELTNVRRFGSQTARLGPFGDGLTTITAENEAGKSTFFDALHALFFTSHTSKAADIKALQPYSGGPVTIAAEIDVDGAGYRVEKTYLAQVSARVTDTATGQVIKQQGDAESWIDAHVNTLSRGPAGLLWVRQGAAAVDPAGKDKDKDNIAARRDLMSSVRGQIDAVTGGRRMDRIMEQVQKEFIELSTQTFRPKAGSPWKKIEDEVVELTLQKEALTQDVAKLAQALKIKTTTQARLRDLQDPERRAERTAQIAAAVAALEEAQKHATEVDRAEQALQLVKADQDRITREIEQITQARNTRARLAEKIAKTQAEAEAATEARTKAEAEVTDAKAKLTAQEAERRRLADALKEARASREAAAHWTRLRGLSDTLTRIAAPREKREAALELLQGPAITQSDLDTLDDLSQRISVAREQRRAHFASVTLRPEGTARARIEGALAPAEEPILIDRPLTLDIDGYGTLSLAPAQSSGAGIEDPAALDDTLQGHLKTLDVDTVAAARDGFARRRQAQSDAEVALAEIRGLAPDGIETLMADYNSLCATLGHPPQTPVPVAETDQSDSVARLENGISTLDAAIDALKPQIATLQQAATEAISAAATAQGALSYLRENQLSNAAPPDEDATLAALQEQGMQAKAQSDAALQTLSRLKTDGPDITTAEATHKRLLEADRADLAEIAALDRELARADGAIEAQSEGAVEERLTAVTEALDKANERAGRFAQQARALALLIDHLDTARADAQETYFEPIRAELHPLLAQLHAGAGFALDPEKMLVDTITRDGVTDAVTALSGGAYEQVAILTRLAFARLFAKQGRHVPVILDDALVHTDDARIGAMFNMLSQAAKDQQIIVLSCRTRAFSDLGGTRARIEVSDT